MFFGQMCEARMARLHSRDHSRDLVRLQRMCARRAGTLMASLAVRALLPNQQALRVARADAGAEAAGGVRAVAERPPMAALRPSRPTAQPSPVNSLKTV